MVRAVNWTSNKGEGVNKDPSHLFPVKAFLRASYPLLGHFLRLKEHDRPTEPGPQIVKRIGPTKKALQRIGAPKDPSKKAFNRGLRKILPKKALTEKDRNPLRRP